MKKSIAILFVLLLIAGAAYARMTVIGIAGMVAAPAGGGSVSYDGILASTVEIAGEGDQNGNITYPAGASGATLAVVVASGGTSGSPSVDSCSVQGTACTDAVFRSSGSQDWTYIAAAVNSAGFDSGSANFTFTLTNNTYGSQVQILFFSSVNTADAIGTTDSDFQDGSMTLSMGGMTAGDIIVCVFAAYNQTVSLSDAGVTLVNSRAYDFNNQSVGYTIATGATTTMTATTTGEFTGCGFAINQNPG